MDHDTRLARLEARLAALEARLGLPPYLPQPAKPGLAAEPAANVASGPIGPAIGPAIGSRSAPPKPAETELAPWPAPPRASAPPPPPRRPQPTEAGKPTGTAGDLERFLGLAVLGRIGIGALVLAAAYFAQLGWTRIGPLGRVVLIELAGGGMLAAGFLLRPRVQPRYVALLFGGATALCYLGGVVAKLRYELIDSGTAMVMLVGTTALGQFLARTIRVQAMATACLAGAYAAPVLVGTASDSPTLFFVYLLALHTWAACIEQWWDWRAARRLAVAATTALAWSWFVNASAMPTPLSVVVHVEVVWLGLCTPELLRAFAHQPIARGRWLVLLGGTWVTQLGLLVWTTYQGAPVGIGLFAGSCLLGTGIWLRGLSEAPSPTEPSSRQGAGLARIGTVLLMFGALVVWTSAPARLFHAADQPWDRLVAMLGAGALIVALRRRSGTSDLALAVGVLCAKAIVLQQPTSESTRLLALVAMILPAALVVLGHTRSAPAYALISGSGLLFFGVSDDFHFAGPQSGYLLLAFVLVALWNLFGAQQATARNHVWLRRSAAAMLLLTTFTWSGLGFGQPVEEPLAAFANLRFPAVLSLVAAFALALRLLPRPAATLDVAMLGLGLGGASYLAGLVEVLTFVRSWPHGWSAVTVSLYTLLFASVLLGAGFVRKLAALRWAGLVGFGTVVVKVPLFDLRDLDTPLRVLVTGALGLVLLLGAFAYARVRRSSSPTA